MRRIIDEAGVFMYSDNIHSVGFSKTRVECTQHGIASRAALVRRQNDGGVTGKRHAEIMMIYWQRYKRIY